MQTKIATVMMAVLCVLGALNAAALLLNVSPPVRAAVGGMSYQQLVTDPGFSRAVKAIVEQCTVNADSFKVKC